MREFECMASEERIINDCRHGHEGSTWDTTTNG